MTKLSVLLCATAAIAAPTLASAQAFPAPLGHRQPTASEVPDESGGALQPRTGRSVSRDVVEQRTDALQHRDDAAPRICSNCDD